MSIAKNKYLNLEVPLFIMIVATVITMFPIGIFYSFKEITLPWLIYTVVVYIVDICYSIELYKDYKNLLGEADCKIMERYILNSYTKPKYRLVILIISSIYVLSIFSLGYIFKLYIKGALLLAKIAAFLTFVSATDIWIGACQYQYIKKKNGDLEKQ